MATGRENDLKAANALPQKVRQWLLRNVPALSGESILVAVSGGLDSMTLLDVMFNLAPVMRWKLFVGHYNHQLRGRLSDADERFVRKAAVARKLRFVAARGDVAGRAKEKGCSIEMAAREMRHAFLAAAAKRAGAGWIATAHHADDQAELFFIRLLRGEGGMRGMAVSNPSPADSSLRIVRPLLSATRPELAAYAAAVGVQFREDASNALTDILRNRIRLKLLPLLASEYQCNASVAAARVMEIIRAEGEFVDTAAGKWLATGKPSFKRLHESVQRRCVHRQLTALGIVVDFDLIEVLRRDPGKRVSAGGQHVLMESGGRVRVVSELPPPPAEIEVRLARRGRIEHGGVELSWSIETGQAMKWQPNLEYFDAESVGYQIRLRNRREGDRFQPIGMPCPIRLQDLFTNAKVPRAERGLRVVAEDSQGRIFWVEGLRMSQIHRIIDHQRPALGWRWVRKSPLLQVGMHNAKIG
jgi:tRNA(Ile)-lysidine synthase